MNRLGQLINWVIFKHEGQFIKRTGEPYINHLIAVAEMAQPLARFGYETGLCHDILEKTRTDPEELQQALIGFGYGPYEAEAIVGQVQELTDVFTKAAYPLLKKAARKAREEERLTKISDSAQTVKYADLIYNIIWVIRYDSGNSSGYLHRKKKLLERMNRGDGNLRRLALDKIALHTR